MVVDHLAPNRRGEWMTGSRALRPALRTLRNPSTTTNPHTPRRGRRRDAAARPPADSPTAKGAQNPAVTGPAPTWMTLRRVLVELTMTERRYRAVLEVRAGMP